MKKAFNLIEVMVVIGIMSILAAALVPTLGNYLPGIQLNGSARTLASDLRLAQEKTVTEQNQYALIFDLSSSPKNYKLVKFGELNEPALKEVDFASNENVTLDSTISDNRIVFSADGGPSSSGNIVLSNNAGSKTINISPAGFIKIQ